MTKDKTQTNRKVENLDQKSKFESIGKVLFFSLTLPRPIKNEKLLAVWALACHSATNSHVTH